MGAPAPSPSGRWWALARIGKRVPPPFEQRQRIGGEGAEVVGQRRGGDRRLEDCAQTDQALEPRCGGDLGILKHLEAARRGRLSESSADKLSPAFLSLAVIALKALGARAAPARSRASLSGSGA